VDKLQRDQTIKVDFTEDATFENVEGYLNEQDYHIIHFTGHGIRTELNQILNQQVPLEVKTSLLVSILNQIRFLVIFDNFEDCLTEDRNDIENP